MSLFPVGFHMLITPSPLLLVSPPLLAVISSCRNPLRRKRLWGVDISLPTMVWTCHRQGSGGGGDYFTPGSLFCPTCGGARSESGGWCVSMPAPSSPPLGIPPNRLPAERRPCRVWGVGWAELTPTEVPVSYYSGPGSVLKAKLLPTPP